MDFFYFPVFHLDFSGGVFRGGGGGIELGSDFL